MNVVKLLGYCLTSAPFRQLKHIHDMALCYTECTDYNTLTSELTLHLSPHTHFTSIQM